MRADQLRVQHHGSVFECRDHAERPLDSWWAILSDMVLDPGCGDVLHARCVSPSHVSSAQRSGGVGVTQLSTLLLVTRPLRTPVFSSCGRREEARLRTCHFMRSFAPHAQLTFLADAVVVLGLRPVLSLRRRKTLELLPLFL